MYSIGKDYYIHQSNNDFTKFTTTHDWNSKCRSPIWRDDFQVCILTIIDNNEKVFKENVDWSTHKLVIIELLDVNIAEKEITPIGWTILPLFTTDSTENESFIQSGKFIVPIFTKQLTLVIFFQILFILY